jgi:hypothetical protein
LLVVLGNLSTILVSNSSEDARTSHPCERGAGLLRYLSNPQEAGVAKISGSYSQNFFVEVCDVYPTRPPIAK